MKLKLKVNNIESGADKITICAYNKQNVIEEFTKEDYGENWEGLIGKEIEINPYFIGDVDQLIVTGIKDHQLSWDNEDKKQRWKEYASDKFDISISPYGRDDLDPEKTIKISNYKERTEPYKSLLKYINLKGFDFSNIKNFYTTINVSTDYLPVFRKIVKLPNVEKNNINLLGFSEDGTYTSVIDVSNLDTKNIKCMSNFLRKNNLIKDISNFNFDNLEVAIYAFEGCTELEKLPQLNFPKLTNGIGMFNNCPKLEKIKSIDFSKSSSYFSNNFNSIFNKLDVEHITLGNTYVYLTAGDFGVVNIGNAKNTFQKDTNNSLFREGETSIKAFPENLLRYNSNNYIKAKVTTPPTDKKIAWVDYIPENNQGPCLKSIVNLKKDINITIKTLKNNFENVIELPVFFEKNQDYPYSFELLDIDFSDAYYRNDSREIDSRYINYTKIKSKPSAYILKRDNTIYKDIFDSTKLQICIEASDIQDGATMSFEINSVGGRYTALIDGEEFIGRINYAPNINCIITFNIEENLDFGFELVEDDSSDDSSDEQ